MNTRMNNPCRQRREHGLSLIELMVAMAISAVLMLGLVQVFSASRATFSANEALARSQENSRFAMDFLKFDLRMGSHMGCLSDLGYENNYFNHLTAGTPDQAPYAYRFDMPVQVYEAAGTAPGDTLELEADPVPGGAGDWSPELPDELAIADEALAGSDVIVVRYLSAESVSLAGLGIVANDTGTMTVAAEDAGFVVDNGVYAVTNCGLISLFNVVTGGASATTVGGHNAVGWTDTQGLALNSRGFTTAQAGKGNEVDYGPALLFRYNFAVYYVANGANGRPALFRKLLDSTAVDAIGAAQEVAPGVESLQVVLGVVNTVPRIDDQPTVYLTAPDVEDGTWRGGADEPEVRWRDVVSMRVGMMMTAANPAAVAGRLDRRVADTVLRTPADGRPRQVYETLVNVRNRSRG